MIELNGHNFKNWQDYFKTTFEITKKYDRVEEGLHGQTICEKYVLVDKNDKTEIKIGYLKETLIYWKFENPLTQGFNKQQDLEYFYRFDFTPGESYGGPGLEFIDINVKAIDKQLKNGLKGKEVQYFKKGQHIKSKLYNYIEDNHETFPDTIYFTKISAWRKFRNLFSKSRYESEMETKEIDLSTIFNGLK